MRLIRPAACAAAALLAITVSPALAADDTTSLTIDSVDGQTVKNGKVPRPLSGRVPVTGTASLSAPPTQTSPLVADAGDSSFVVAGEHATLLGAGFGGTAPYSFAWTAADGEVLGADAATAQLDTTGLGAGRHPVSLTVEDADGATARDDVIVVVTTEQTATLLEESKNDATPGLTGTGSTVEFPFEVPAGTDRMDVAITWGVPTNDYDLRVLDPAGAEKGSSGGAPPATQEATGVADPEPGTWTVVADKYATVADTVTATVTATSTGDDPRPTVDAGGPYSFLIGAAQSLDGAVTGGAAPVESAWDLDGDGVFETAGTDVTAELPEGRNLVTLKATDADGLERRQTTSVLVASEERLAEDTTAVTVIGVADSGINPYHFEFSADTYPDPSVLALTDDFTRHPSEYVPGYPKDAEALPITLGQGYFPATDRNIWEGNATIQPGEMYWIPGTKIIGAVDAGGSTGATSGEDTHPILDDNGHGSGSASVSAGNRYGYCPTCLLVVVEALDETVVAGLPWVDISTNSFGYIGGVPLGLLVGGSQETKAAAERGQTTLFAAGNGIGNAFDVPISTYGSDQTGPDWNITVGALRRDNQRAIVGDGIPVHLSAWGDGNLPSACRTGTVGQCAFGGTSAATPYTAGVFGTVLTNVRQEIGDGAAGQKPGQVVAKGVAIDGSTQLADGELTRAELREAVLKTAQPLNTDNEPVSPYPYTLTAPYNENTNVLFEGYGAATPEGAERATAVLLGNAPMPDRSYEDEFFAIDRQIRDGLYGGYDRDGDGSTDSQAFAAALDVADVTEVDGALSVIRRVARASAPDLAVARGDNDMSWFLHRKYAGNPGDTEACSATSNEQFMSQENLEGDLEPCFESRVTSVVAAYRPLGIFASSDTTDAPIPADSTVTAEVFLAAETPSAVRPTGVLMAGDREVGRGEGSLNVIAGSGPSGAGCAALGEACWTKYELSFDTTRPVFTGEQLTFQVEMIGARSWAFGLEGEHASKVTIAPAEVPSTGYDFGASITSPAEGSTLTEGEDSVAGGAYAFPERGEDPTGAGDHPETRLVEVSLDDPGFGSPIEATLDEASGTWSAPLGELAVGEHTVFARARVDDRTSEVSTSSFTVTSSTAVEWQVVERNEAADPAAWQRAEGFGAWSFAFDTADHGSGARTIITRVVDGGSELARRSVSARFR